MQADYFDNIQSLILKKLGMLNPALTYHSIDHTLDVVKQTALIAAREHITNEREIFLLAVAALYHDAGFLQTYSQHETVSCSIFLADAEALHIGSEEQDIIRGLIMATRIPQLPNTRLEQIICDADLDYLGRTDFFTISDLLRKEFLHYKFVQNNAEWYQLQLTFLKNHQYHTASSRQVREPCKQENIKKLEQ